jgi:hypothetical protein
VELWIALVGVIGTVVVGLAGIIATFFAPDWSQRRIARRRLVGDFQSAQRLVSEELHVAGIHAKAIADHNYAFPPDAVNFLLTVEWQAHKGVLSRTLRPDAWVTVRDAYTNINQARSALAFAPGAPLEDKHVTIVRSLVRQAQEAGDALAAAKPDRVGGAPLPVSLR